MSRPLLGAAGRASRALHASGVLGPSASGAVRRATARARGQVTYRNRSGHTVEADLSDYMERTGFFGAHSAAFIRRLRRLLRPGDWAIDAGANVGLIASPMAAAVGRGGAVWAIEPLPRNLARLQRLRDANDLSQLTILPVALAATASTAELRLSAAPGGSGWGSFVSPWAGEATVSVPTAPLDDLVASHAPDRPLRLLKVDLEGYEREMLRGATATLTDHRPVVACEFHDPLLRAAGSSSGDLLAAFADLGYAPDDASRRLATALDGRVVDLLLVPRGAASR
jgi:FkbM family methyltransferase